VSKAELTLKSLYGNLSRGQKCLADFLLANSQKVPSLSVQAIAKAGKVSAATVSRLARKLGYRTLGELKLELARESAPAPGYFYREIGAEDSEEELIEKVFLGNMKSLEDTLKMLDKTQLLAAVRRILQARSVVFLGIGSSGFIAREAAMRFSMLGLPAYAFTDASEMYFRCSTSGQRDVVIGISHSGRTVLTVRALELARTNGALTIGISNYLDSPLQAASSYFFCTSFPESRVQVTSLSSRIAQLGLVDALYLLAARFRKGSADYERINARMESLLRVPERS
jgi:DNA-binding MurR/RpiR family transcriptional regulator